MKNYIGPGNTVSFTASGQAYTSGQPAPYGSFGLGICKEAIADGSTGTMHIGGGIFQLAKKAATAFGFGARLYWDLTAKEITDVAGDGRYIGTAYAAALSADTTILVRKNNDVPPVDNT